MAAYKLLNDLLGDIVLFTLFRQSWLPNHLHQRLWH